MRAGLFLTKRNNKKKMVGYSPHESHNARHTETNSATHTVLEGDGVGSSTQPQGMNLLVNILSSRQKTFWLLQASGWFGYFCVRMFHGTIFGQTLEYIPLIASATILGLLLTIALRLFYQRIRDLALPTIIVAILISSALLGVLLSAFETSTMPFFLPGSEPYQGVQRLGNAMFESTVIFAWSAIYFGYHYYEGFQEQRARALKAQAMAHQAQLKMLRYQLNPHFLFNTLNAISTLVLEKSEVDANRMLTKLASFLRYTLVNQPTQRVTLDQELHALSLYLDIEKVRFQDRLLIKYDIDDQARSALVPSLILQPLIENIIKYAIAPSIDGGVIMICAKVEEGRLLLGLTDSGPGMEDLNNIVSKSGFGVGLVNTKERLAQIYGDEHTFTMKNIEPTGLGVFIEIPCEHEGDG